MKSTFSDRFERHMWLWWAVWATVGGLLGGGYFLSRPWWFGHPVPLSVWSGEVAAIALGTLALWWLAWQRRRGGAVAVQRAAQQPTWLWGWGWLTWLSLGLALTPSSFWGNHFRAMVLWRHSLLLWVWLAWVGGSAWFLGWKRQGTFHRPALTGWRTFAVVLALWGAAAVFVVFTGWGWRPPHYWQGVGVPILSGQIWLLLTSLGFGITVVRWTPLRFWAHIKARDVIIVMSLWLLTFGVWWLTPSPPTYFQPAAFPPNYERYPFSDAETYGLAGEQGVLGYGYFSNRLAPRGTLGVTHVGIAGLLALIQLWVKRVSTITAILLLLLAWTPAMLYLLGAAIHSRGSGLLLAGVAMLRERNAILHANMFYVTSHVHMWVTEPLLREIFILFALSVFIFLQHPWKRKSWLFAAGSLIALGFLVRRENLVLMALVPALALLPLFSQERFFRRLVKAIVLGGMVVGGMTAVLAPWVARNRALALRLPERRHDVSVMSSLFLGPVKTVLSPEFRTEVFKNSSQPASETGSTVNQATSSPTPTATPQQGEISMPQPVKTTQAPSSSFWNLLMRWHEGLVVAVGDLFIRNILALVLTFPPLLRFYPLKVVIREKTSLWMPFSPSWYRILWETRFLLLAQIVALSVGIAALWHKRREFVLFLLGLMVSYLGVSAIARDAGGRYVVPVDWVLPLFAVVGWVVLLQKGFTVLGGTLPAWLQTSLDFVHSSSRLTRWGWRAGGSAVLLSLAMVVLEFGAMGWVAYSGQAGASTWPATTPPRWRPATPDEILHRLDMLHVWTDLPWSRSEVQQALMERHVIGGWGYLFYPRYVTSPSVCGDLCSHEEIDSPHLFFAGLLGGQGQLRFQMALASPPRSLKNGSEMIVLFGAGCGKTNKSRRIEAFALIQINHPAGAPPQGKADVFVPPHAALRCAATASQR